MQMALGNPCERVVENHWSKELWELTNTKMLPEGRQTPRGLLSRAIPQSSASGTLSCAPCHNSNHWPWTFSFSQDFLTNLMKKTWLFHIKKKKKIPGVPYSPRGPTVRVLLSLSKRESLFHFPAIHPVSPSPTLEHFPIFHSHPPRTDKSRRYQYWTGTFPARSTHTIITMFILMHKCLLFLLWFWCILCIWDPLNWFLIAGNSYSRNYTQRNTDSYFSRDTTMAPKCSIVDDSAPPAE